MIAEDSGSVRVLATDGNRPHVVPIVFCGIEAALETKYYEHVEIGTTVIRITIERVTS